MHDEKVLLQAWAWCFQWLHPRGMPQYLELYERARKLIVCCHSCLEVLAADEALDFRKPADMKALLPSKTVLWLLLLWGTELIIFCILWIWHPQGAQEAPHLTLLFSDSLQQSGFELASVSFDCQELWWLNHVPMGQQIALWDTSYTAFLH